MSKVVIVGAGIAGLAASVRLAVKGHEVTVFETNAYAGGKLSAFELGDYRFDAGPSLFTMPQFVTQLFELAGEEATSHFRYQKKKIACQYFWDDGVRFTAHSDRKKFLDEIETSFGEPQTSVSNYLGKAKRKYDLTHSIFLEKSLHKFSTYFSATTLKALLQFPVFQIDKTLHQVNKKTFSSPHLIQLFDRFATYNGSDPYQTSGIMTLIQHLEQFYGTYIPEGGMEQITSSVYELALRKGVVFKFNTQVDQIVVNQNKVRGIQAEGTFHEADLVVSNMDVFPTYKKLLKEHPFPGKQLNQERSSSAVIFYWGIKKTFPELDLHNIFFSKDYQAEFEHIFKTKTVSEDPTVYVNITSKDVPGDAPKDCENWFVMINTPADSGQDWELLVNTLREKVIEKLSRVLGVSLAPLIACEEVLTPPKIQSKTQSHLGALYGASSNDPMAAFLRHPNFSQRIKNLYFCGGSVHPGGGIPLCLLSAKIVEELISSNN